MYPHYVLQNVNKWIKTNMWWLYLKMVNQKSPEEPTQILKIPDPWNPKTKDLGDLVSGDLDSGVQVSQRPWFRSPKEPDTENPDY